MFFVMASSINVGLAFAHPGKTNHMYCHTNLRSLDFHCHGEIVESSHTAHDVEGNGWCYDYLGQARCGYAEIGCRPVAAEIGISCYPTSNVEQFSVFWEWPQHSPRQKCEGFKSQARFVAQLAVYTIDCSRYSDEGEAE